MYNEKNFGTRNNSSIKDALCTEMRLYSDQFQQATMHMYAADTYAAVCTPASRGMGPYHYTFV